MNENNEMFLTEEEMENLISDADARLKEYKENNEGWL